MKYKKTFITFFVFILVYFYMFFNIEKIQTIFTFPGIGANIQDLVGYKNIDLKFEEINLKDNYGNNINGLYLSGSKQEVVYYFHGNGGPLKYFYSEIKYINDLGYSVFAYDYPGYGKSTGFPDKNVVLNFSKTFFEYIKSTKKIENQNLIIWGYSVGTAVASDFAFKNDFNKLVLVAPFSSRYDMGAKYLFGFPPQKLFFKPNSFITSSLVKQLKKPVLIIHGNFDMIVPFNQGKKVFNNYVGEKYFIELDKTGHNGIIDEFGEGLRKIFIDFISGEKLEFSYLFVDEEKKQELEQINIQNSFSGEILKETKTLNPSKQEISIKNQENVEKINLIEEKNFDFKTDNSITKYVSPNISFEKINYVPDDLVSISGEFIIDTKGNQTLRKEAFEKLDELSRDFYNNFGVKLSIVSAYRSYNYQVGIKSRGCSDLFCAKAGYSEHQTGLAFDMFETTTKDEFLSKPYLKNYFEWMEENAHKYGFHNSYQKGREIDGYEIEPWHWRYVGKGLAKELYEEKITFSQFFEKTKK